MASLRRRALLKCQAIPVCCARHWFAISPNCGNESCVHGQLDSAEKWQAFGNHLEALVVVGVGHSKNRISDELVGGNPCPGLSADPPGAFQSEPFSPENPTPRALCTVEAKGVEWTATPATAQRACRREHTVCGMLNSQSFKID